jgi:hypothetical protein
MFAHVASQPLADAKNGGKALFRKKDKRKSCFSFAFSTLLCNFAASLRHAQDAAHVSKETRT